MLQPLDAHADSPADVGAQEGSVDSDSDTDAPVVASIGDSEGLAISFNDSLSPVAAERSEGAAASPSLRLGLSTDAEDFHGSDDGLEMVSLLQNETAADETGSAPPRNDFRGQPSGEQQMEVSPEPEPVDVEAARASQSKQQSLVIDVRIKLGRAAPFSVEVGLTTKLSDLRARITSVTGVAMDTQRLTLMGSGAGKDAKVAELTDPLPNLRQYPSPRHESTAQLLGHKSSSCGGRPAQGSHAATQDRFLPIVDGCLILVEDLSPQLLNDNFQVFSYNDEGLFGPPTRMPLNPGQRVLNFDGEFRVRYNAEWQQQKRGEGGDPTGSMAPLRTDKLEYDELDELQKFRRLLGGEAEPSARSDTEAHRASAARGLSTG